MWRSDGESRVATIHNSLSLMTLMVVLKEPHPNLLGAAGAVGRGIVYLPREALRDGRQVSVLRRRGG